MKNTKTETLDCWAEIVREFAPIIPEEYKTVIEIAKKMNVPRQSARDRMEKLINQNRAEKRKFMVNGRLKNHYKLI